jgi:hypothetical protein
MTGKIKSRKGYTKKKVKVEVKVEETTSIVSRKLYRDLNTLLMGDWGNVWMRVFFFSSSSHPLILPSSSQS